MAGSKVCLVAIVCSFIILSSFISSTHSASCCLMYSKRQPRCMRMMGYTIQTINNSCDINAVIFHMPGRFLCADPSASWTKSAMRCLDQRRRNDTEKSKSA